MAGRRIAGIDFGTVRLGVAIADDETRIASPLCQHTRRSRGEDAAFFKKLLRDEGVQLFVVGLPVHLSGQDSRVSVAAEEFGAWLQRETGVPVTYFDERFTTAFADQVLQEANLTKQRRKDRRDMLAAQAMLAAYLDAEAAGSADEAPRGIDH